MSSSVGKSRGPMNYSENTAIVIDSEVRRIIDTCYHQAKDLIGKHMDKLTVLAEALLERETLDKEDVDNIMNGDVLAPFIKPGTEVPPAVEPPVVAPGDSNPNTTKNDPFIQPA